VIRYHERKVDYSISAPDLQAEQGYASVKKGRDERNETGPTSRYIRGEREEKIEISREAVQKKKSSASKHLTRSFCGVAACMNFPRQDVALATS